MKPFCIDEEFYHDIQAYFIELDIYFNDKKEQREIIEANFSDTWEQKIEFTQLEKIFKVDSDIIGDIVERLFMLHEDRLPEEEGNVTTKVKEAIKASIDIEKLNSLLPELWYPNGEFSKLTKQDLLDAI